MSILRAALTAAASLCVAACSASHDDLSRAVLQPQAEWLVEPSDLGLDAEAFEVLVGEATLYGYLVRSPRAQGRTVVLFHDRAGNVSALHPYLTFLNEAGLNVCVFDYRGFGKSTGKVSLRGMFLDSRHVLDWLTQQRGIEKDRIAYYGIGLGGAAALRVARFDTPCKAIVLDEPAAPRDFIAMRAKLRGDDLGNVSIGFTEFSTLPENTDPADNASSLAIPSLWLVGSESPKESRLATLRAWFEAGGDKRLVAMRGASSPPNAMLTHDGEYQRLVAQFLVGALAGSPESVVATGRNIAIDAAGKGKNQIEVVASGGSPTPEAPWAIEIAAFDADATPTWGAVWMEGARARITLELPSEPGAIAATRVGDAVRGEAATFTRQGTALSRAGGWVESKAADFLRLEDEPPSAEVAHAAAKSIRDREAIEPFPPLVETELARVYGLIGRALARAGNAEDRAAALVWLQRAIAAAPQKPERHWWPGRSPHYGFNGQDAVADARALLKKLTGD